MMTYGQYIAAAESDLVRAWEVDADMRDALLARALVYATLAVAAVPSPEV